jgi:DNA-binding CsgD family transcriptional regulator
MDAVNEAQMFGRALTRLQRYCVAPLAFGGPIRNGELQVDHVLGNNTRSLFGLHVLPGRGLGGRALSERHLTTVRDYGAALNITHDYDKQVLTEGVRGLTAVPVIVNQEVRGALYVASKSVGLPGDVVTGPLLSVSRKLAQDLAMNDEVERRVRSIMEEGASSSLPEVRELAELRDELCGIAAQLDNPELQGRVHSAAQKLAALGHHQSADDAGSGGERLSPREIEVLGEVEIGCTNAEAAEHLNLKPETVKAYLRSASHKLKVHSRYQAVLAARRRGLLATREPAQSA